MHLVRASSVAVSVALLTAGLHAAARQDADRKVAGGGITAQGWTGQVDPGPAKQGKTVADSKFAREGNALHVAIGPAATYWNPANRVSGDYAVKATFKELKNNSSHPHPYGVVIGNKFGTDQQNYMYCVAYGDGTFLVRRFNGNNVPTVTPKTANAAIHKAAADGTVTQEIGWSVHGSRVECRINGTVVAGFDKGEVVGAGKLDSTDGVYGLRFSHNLDVVVSDLRATKR
jgi:hypothetical protein